MQKATLITLCWELYEQGVSKVRIAARLSEHRETVHLWIKGVQQYWFLGFLDRYERAKKGGRQSRRVGPIVKRWVWAIREREMGCCGQKIQYFLEHEYDTHLSVPKIYEILAEKYVIRSRWEKNHSRGPIPQASQPREVIQLTRALALSWAQDNVQVNCIVPGFFDTSAARPGRREIETETARRMDFFPAGRAGMPQEIGSLAVFLASDASSYITGGIFATDGGALAGGYAPTGYAPITTIKED